MAGKTSCAPNKFLNNSKKPFSEMPTAPGSGREETEMFSTDCTAIISKTEYPESPKALYIKYGTKKEAVFCIMVIKSIAKKEPGFVFRQEAP